ncbi:MAG: S9 family peptidase [Acidimicrobiaceae bacterium]|nr:S9 family peptidase [Acidimicrobiaceae bacterium]
MTVLDHLFLNAGDPPRAEEIPEKLIHFQDQRVDEYYWLRERESPKVLELLNKENQYTKSVTAELESLEEQLFSEIKGRIKETDLSAPVRKGSYIYFSKTEEGLQYPIHARKRIGTETEEILVDENEEALGHSFFALGGLSISPSEDLVAYLTDLDGSELYTLTVRSISAPRDVKARLENCYYGLSWSLDSQTIFYTRTDSQMRPYQVWCLDFVTGESRLVFQEDDDAYFVGIGTTKDDKYIVIEVGSKTTTQIFTIDASFTKAEPKPFSKRVKDLEYSIEHWREHFFVVTNRDNPDFGLMMVDEGVNDHTKWKPYLETVDGVRLLDIEVFADYLALQERYLATARLRIVDLRSKSIFEVQKSEEVSSIYIGENEEFESTILRYEYSSMITPRSVFEIDLETKKSTLLKQSEVLGDFDSSRYATFRIWANSEDNTKIPISVVCRADLQPDGTGHPTLVYGYGSYEHSIDPTFSSLRLSLLDRGIVFAFAHIRGGGEMGRNWYLDGKLENKKHTFTDFIDCTRTLIDLGWADPDKIAARGGSAGGMLMGAIANMAPNLYKVIVAEVPFVDCLTTILDPSLPLTTFEWEEWGNPITDKAIYDVMKSYTPYDNVGESQYPFLLVTAGLNDPRVSYWEPAKWVQRLRKKTANPRVILKIEMGSGHQGPSGRYDAWRDEAFVYAFLLTALESAQSPGSDS